tara:strand:- start:493 stop:894 length:402 start_codon:yes stop_codon:yes gene_type:complete
MERNQRLHAVTSTIPMPFAHGEAVRMSAHPARRGYISGPGYRAGDAIMCAVHWEHGIGPDEPRDRNGTYPASMVAHDALEIDWRCAYHGPEVPATRTVDMDGRTEHVCDDCADGFERATEQERRYTERTEGRD